MYVVFDVQSSYWSAKKHEVYGVVQNSEGRTVHRLYGKWNEGLYYGDPQTAKCVWRPGELNNGFYASLVIDTW